MVRICTLPSSTNPQYGSGGGGRSKWESPSLRELTQFSHLPNEDGHSIQCQVSSRVENKRTWLKTQFRICARQNFRVLRISSQRLRDVRLDSKPFFILPSSIPFLLHFQDGGQGLTAHQGWGTQSGTRAITQPSPEGFLLY